MNALKTLTVIAACAILLLPALPAAAGLTAVGGGPILGPLVLRSSGSGQQGGQDFGPSGVFFGVGGMGYAEFGSFRLGGIGMGTGLGSDRDQFRSMLGFGGVTLDLLMRPGEGKFTLPLGLIVGGGGYVLKDMSSPATESGGVLMGSDKHGYATWEEARTIYDTPFFMLGPRIGFAAEIIPWLRLEGNASFLAMFRDQGTSYAFVLTIGPIFGKFDMRPPNPSCEGDFPGCRDRGYSHIPSYREEPDADDNEQ